MSTSTSEQEILPVNIENELKQSYLGYAMSVIVGRALPDVRDGLKPVHRRVLFAMHVLNNDWNKPYKKSARVVGDVIGKYHPHGDSAVYDTIVRMAQSFSMRYVFVDGQGNFGSVDGDAAAAMRYTEVRMAKITHTLLADIDKETVDYSPNYDETEYIPDVLPTRVPSLLVNGSSGIAVGMATNIPTHNISEIINACRALNANPELTVDDLLQYVPGPDFPTCGIINGRAGIIKAYQTGRGRIYVRARTHIEEDESNGKPSIIVTELPYQVNKARLLEKIAELVKDKKIDGITGLRDESDKSGMRMVIELRRGEMPEVVLNHLYVHTQLQNVFGINMVALEEGEPRVLNLKQILEAFLRHRREVVTRRTIYNLRKAKERAHILEGLGVALVNLDTVIQLIKSAPNPDQAKQALVSQVWHPGMVASWSEQLEGTRPDHLSQDYGLLSSERYQFSPEQAQAILDLRLHRLTGLEQDKILNEYKQMLERIAEYQAILGSHSKLLEVIDEELKAIKDEFGDQRRTEIIESQQDVDYEDLIQREEMVVTFSHQGYVKAQPVSAYRAQHRGGKGKAVTAVKEDDFIEQLIVAHSHDYLLCFSNQGKAYWLKVYQLPQAGPQSRGRPIVNMLPLNEAERISAALPVTQFEALYNVVMVTACGVIKKVSLDQFSRPRSNGIIAVDLADDDYLIGVDITDGQQDIMLLTNGGKGIRFSEDQVRTMGRNARGVRGIKLQDDQQVISLIIADDKDDILTATANGYGKRTPVEQYRCSGRGGQGVIAIPTQKRNGELIGAVQVNADDEIMLVTDKGRLIRIGTNEVSQVGRSAAGVKLVNLNQGEYVINLAKVGDVDDESESEQE